MFALFIKCSAALLLLVALSCAAASHFPAQNSSRSPADVFTTNSSNTSFAFEWQEGMILIPLSLNGSRPLRFAMDSGSTRILIDRTLATSLGLKSGEASSLQGAGSGRVAIEAVHNVDLAFPGLDSKGYDCYTADLKPLEQTLKTRVDGILGYDFFARFVVTVDFAAKQITIVSPSAFHPVQGAEKVSLDIHDKWPFVKGQIVLPGGVVIEDSFLIDSGSSDAVDHPIAKTMENKAASKSGVGIGSPIEGAIARAESFRIGTFTIEAPIVSCCGATEATSRLIGNEILRRFTVTFDYPSVRLFLLRNNAT